jgi:hypothetical protein
MPIYWNDQQIFFVIYIDMRKSIFLFLLTLSRARSHIGDLFFIFDFEQKFHNIELQKIYILNHINIEHRVLCNSL